MWNGSCDITNLVPTNTQKHTDMISEAMVNVAQRKGIKSVRFDASGPIVQVNDTECKILALDENTGGIWYQLNSKTVIPMEMGMVYVYPAAMRCIQFNE